MTGKAKILVADDESRLRHLVRMYLENEGYQVEEARTGREAVDKVSSGEFQLLILDIMMPDGDGWSVCRQIRQTLDIPIIMLTARGDEIDRVLGFELGADDYVVKPFSPRELAARVKALLRRTMAGSHVKNKNEELTFGLLTINNSARKVRVGDQDVILTPKEFDLLYFLAHHPGQVFSREQILQKVWGYDFYGDLRTVDTHVKNLREKLNRAGGQQKYIGTVWGVGYKFEVVP